MMIALPKKPFGKKGREIQSDSCFHKLFDTMPFVTLATKVNKIVLYW